MELETCKDELGFFRHKNEELEEIICMERKKTKEADEKLKVCEFAGFGHFSCEVLRIT